MGKDKKKNVVASTTFNILGTYEGEVLDSNITNKNGLDITSDVIRAVLDSEDYRDGIENGWFIGYLGHPEDPNCMEFERGCIVMTEMSINDDGKVYGKFNLIDTPVGQIVKKFQDAGVNFGISIRGAGDIVNNAVDPDTFVFRGFDLVSFPAYPESIPTFTAIAASTNLEDRKKYQAVCASVKANIDMINSAATIEVLKSQFAPQSEEYKMLENRIDKITCSDAVDIKDQKIEAMTNLYLDTLSRCEHLSAELSKRDRVECAMKSKHRRKIESIERIMASQLEDTIRGMDEAVEGSKYFKNKVKILSAQLVDVKKQLSDAKNSNLIYKQKIESSTNAIRKKDRTIADLRSELHETVTASTRAKKRTSNLDDTVKSLQDEVSKYKSQLRSYQDAYVELYAGALGLNPESLSVTASTTVDDIQKMVSGATNTSNIPAAYIEPEYTEFAEDVDDNELIYL